MAYGGNAEDETLLCHSAFATYCTCYDMVLHVYTCTCMLHSMFGFGYSTLHVRPRMHVVYTLGSGRGLCQTRGSVVCGVPLRSVYLYTIWYNKSAKKRKTKTKQKRSGVGAPSQLASSLVLPTQTDSSAHRTSTVRVSHECREPKDERRDGTLMSDDGSASRLHDRSKRPGARTASALLFVSSSCT